MTDLYLRDPDVTRLWAPFLDARPISELRAGAWLIRERWEAIAGGETRGILAREALHSFTEDSVPPVGPIAPVAGPALVGRADFAACMGSHLAHARNTSAVKERISHPGRFHDPGEIPAFQQV